MMIMIMILLIIMIEKFPDLYNLDIYLGIYLATSQHSYLNQIETAEEDSKRKTTTKTKEKAKQKDFISKNHI